MRNPPSGKGNYLLIFNNKNEIKVFIPRFGDLILAPGIYVYCGSAHGKGGLRARIDRHRSRMVKKFWHIDFLKEFLNLEEIWFQESIEKNECTFSNFLVREMGCTSPIKGFGSSDCRNGCKSHLILLPEESDLKEFFNYFVSQFGRMTRIENP